MIKDIIIIVLILTNCFRFITKTDSVDIDGIDEDMEYFESNIYFLTFLIYSKTGFRQSNK
jgi:hypothetical protein